MADGIVPHAEPYSALADRTYVTASRLRIVLTTRAVQHRTLPCTDTRLLSELALLIPLLSYHPNLSLDRKGIG